MQYFTPKDFEDVGTIVRAISHNFVDPSILEVIKKLSATIANKKIETIRTIYSTASASGIWVENISHMQEDAPLKPTHRAKLICMEVISETLPE